MVEAAALPGPHRRCPGCGAADCQAECRASMRQQHRSRRRRPGPARIRRRRTRKAPGPSPRRIGRWQQLRYWLDHQHQLKRAEMHRGGRLLGARRAGKLYHVTPPHLEAEDFTCHYTLPFLVLLTLACCHRKHSHLHATNRELAELLRCSPRTVYNATREAVDRGYAVIRPMYEPVPTNGEKPLCRCGHDHGEAAEAPCAQCPCWSSRPLLHRQLGNAYAPAWKLRRLWSHWRAFKGELAEHFADPKEGGNGCDPSPLATTPAREIQTAMVVDPPAATNLGGPSGPPAPRPVLSPLPRPAPAAAVEQARGHAPSRLPPAAAPHADDDTRPRPRLKAEQRKDRATVGDSGPAARSAAALPSAWRLPALLHPSSAGFDWRDLDERLALWLDLADRGASEEDAAAAVARLAAEQARRRKGAAPAQFAGGGPLREGRAGP